MLDMSTQSSYVDGLAGAEDEVEYLEGDVPGDEVVGEDGEGGAAHRRRVLVDSHVRAAHYLVDAGTRVRVEADVRRRRAVPLQQDVAFPPWDGDLLPARTDKSLAHQQTKVVKNVK